MAVSHAQPQLRGLSVCSGDPELPQLKERHKMLRIPLGLKTFCNQSACQDSLPSDASSSPWRSRRGGFNLYLWGLYLGAHTVAAVSLGTVPKLQRQASPQRTI